MYLKVARGIALTILLLLPSSINAQTDLPLADVNFEYGLEGTAGAKFFFGQLQGFFCGLKISVLGPGGDKVHWSSAMAETVNLDVFKGYSRPQYLGFNAGGHLSSGIRGVVIYGGFALLRSKEYRTYQSTHASMGYRDYYVLDRIRKKYIPGVLIGLYQRTRLPHVGLGYSSATSRIFISIGWPVPDMFR